MWWWWWPWKQRRAASSGSPIVASGVDLEDKRYGAPPWIFRGTVAYQLYLIPSAEARRFVPPELHLVSFAGWTLGGLYLARYKSSPVGPFDELVTLVGLCWKPPASAAWAGAVHVSSKSAYDHGTQDIGLPSRVAQFEWNTPARSVLISDVTSSGIYIKPYIRMLSLPKAVLNKDDHQQEADTQSSSLPTISLPLPSYSGSTDKVPDILKYMVSLKAQPCFARSIAIEGYEDQIITCLKKPLFSIVFHDVEMNVDEPKVHISRLPDAATGGEMVAGKN